MSDSDLELYGIVGRMFREIRESKDLSLETVAEYLQIAPKSLQRYECGERKIKIGTIKQLCVFYKIEYDDFIREAKLRFGKNIYKNESPKEESPKIMQYYEQLNDIGKHVATERVKELAEIQKYTIGGIPVRAAHYNEKISNMDTEFSEELRKSDEKIIAELKKQGR